MYMRTGSVRVDGGERDFRFLIRLLVRHHRGCGIVQEQRFRIRRFFVDRYAHVTKGAYDGFDRRGLREVVREVVVDFGMREKALRLAELDQRPHLLLAFRGLLGRAGRAIQGRIALLLARRCTAGPGFLGWRGIAGSRIVAIKTCHLSSSTGSLCGGKPAHRRFDTRVAVILIAMTAMDGRCLR
jgi:hypothetical protein